MRTRSNRSADLTAVVLLALALWPLACSDTVAGGPPAADAAAILLVSESVR